MVSDGIAAFTVGSLNAPARNPIELLAELPISRLRGHCITISNALLAVV